MKDFLKDLWANNKKDIFQVLVMVILFVWALLSMQRCSTLKLNYETAQNNIVALTDSLEYYHKHSGLKFSFFDIIFNSIKISKISILISCN